MKYLPWCTGYCPHNGCFAEGKILMHWEFLTIYPVQALSEWERLYRQTFPCGHAAEADQEFFVR